MGLLRALFGPSKDEVWQQLCGEIGAEFVTGGFWHGSKVVAHVKEWTVTLDTYSSGDDGPTYTRMRAPYVNKDGFRFTIYRKGFFSGLGKVLGMQDIEVGYPEFDEAFIIKANDDSRARALLANRKIRGLLEGQPTVRLQVKDDEGWFGAKFPEGVDELYIEAPGVIKDLGRLKSLYDLFAETLNHLCHIGSAYERDPELDLR